MTDATKALFDDIRRALAKGQNHAVRHYADPIEGDTQLWRDAYAALEQIENAVKDAAKLADDFVMWRVGPRNYEPFYAVRTKLLDCIGRG